MLRTTLLALILLPAATLAITRPAAADNTPHNYAVQASVWTTHFSPQPYHNNNQRLLGIERFGDNFVTNPLVDHTPLFDTATPLAGATLFRNSFNQRSAYAYAGFRQPMARSYRTEFYLKLTGGLIHGYRGEHRDKIPFNRFGTTVAVIPSLGIQHNRVNAEAVVFGMAGMMINVGFSF